MWIIFRDPNTVFNHVDKCVVDVVADGEILAYQAQMGKGRTYEIMQEVYFLQPLFTSPDEVEYFARKYKKWTNVRSMYTVAQD